VSALFEEESDNSSDPGATGASNMNGGKRSLDEFEQRGGDTSKVGRTDAYNFSLNSASGAPVSVASLPGLPASQPVNPFVDDPTPETPLSQHITADRSEEHGMHGLPSMLLQHHMPPIQQQRLASVGRDMRAPPDTHQQPLYQHQLDDSAGSAMLPSVQNPFIDSLNSQLLPLLGHLQHAAASQNITMDVSDLSSLSSQLPFLLLGNLQGGQNGLLQQMTGTGTSSARGFDPATIAHLLGGGSGAGGLGTETFVAPQQHQQVRPASSAGPAGFPAYIAQQPFQGASHLAAAMRQGPTSSGNVPSNLGNDRTPLVLYTTSDDTTLSAYQCLVRQQIEMFEAIEDDVQFNISKMSKAIVLGQVGIRCRHCAILPPYSRPKAAVYYPRTLDSLYQFGQNMVKNHLCGTCRSIPNDTRKTLMNLQEERRRGKGGRERWAEAARIMGVYEDSDGLRFSL
jgi:hypothetical protein